MSSFTLHVLNKSDVSKQRPRWTQFSVLTLKELETTSISYYLIERTGERATFSLTVGVFLQVRVHLCVFARGLD